MITRYDMLGRHDWSVESMDGDWTKYTDHLADKAQAVATLKAENEALRNAMRFVEAEVIERCAKICDALGNLSTDTAIGYDKGYTMGAKRASEIIRELSKEAQVQGDGE